MKIVNQDAMNMLNAIGHMGELVEVDDTETIFVNPSDPRTQDYITGRFG